MNLPSFKYHPDPVGTGSFEAADITCSCCGESREFVYAGSTYGKAELEGPICPWCISSGLAHEKFDVEFIDIAAIGDYDPSASVPAEIRDEIAFRTPGFIGWQQERWLVHCGDACAFLGLAGKDELLRYESQELLDSLRADVAMDDTQFRDYLEDLDKELGPTAYVFQCLHCRLYKGYSDDH